MDRITGTSIVKLMRKHGKTIRGLAVSMGITQRRVRFVREYGVEGAGFVHESKSGAGATCATGLRSSSESQVDRRPSHHRN